MSEKKRWEVMAEMLKGRDIKLGAELGVKEGKLAEYLLREYPDLHMVCIDLFAKRPPMDLQGYETYEKWDFAAITKEYMDRMMQFMSRVETLVMDTEEAALKYEDETFDFVFIDAEHTYEGVRDDIAAWYPKLKKGGIMAGHDFSHKWPGVERAVGEAFNLMTVVLGDDHVWAIQK